MIPIFRAKKIDSNEYVEGYLNIWEQSGKIYNSIMEIGKYPSPFNNIHIVEESTLSIHFPDMVDSQGNKIFASLQKDGKGGDLIDNFNFQEKYRIQTAIYKYNCFHLIDKDNDTYSLIECKLQKGIKVIGVKE